MAVSLTGIIFTRFFISDAAIIAGYVSVKMDSSPYNEGEWRGGWGTDAVFSV